MKSRNSAKLNRLDHFTVESLIRDGDSLDRHGARRGKPGFTLDGGGLYLKTTRGAVTDNQGKVIAPGTGSWAFRYEKDGTPRYPGLGVCSSVTLKEARDRAHEMRKLLDSGIDPLDHREAVKQKAEIDKAKAVTFGFCAELWLQRKRDARRDKEYVDNLKANLRKYAGDLWDLPIRSIDTTIVLTILEPIWTRIPPTADGVVRFALEQIFDLAKARGYRDRDSENPARWKGNLQHVLLVRASELHTVQHRRMLPYAELPKLITVLRNWDKQPGLKRDGTFARAQHFMILTTTRPKETSGARFDEIDFKNRIWHIPAARMKKRRAHDIPLPEQAMEIVQEQYERAITGARHFTSLGRRIRAAIEAHPDFGCDRIARIVAVPLSTSRTYNEINNRHHDLCANTSLNLGSRVNSHTTAGRNTCTWPLAEWATTMSTPTDFGQASAHGVSKNETSNTPKTYASYNSRIKSTMR
jgi:integrase